MAILISKETTEFYTTDINTIFKCTRTHSFNTAALWLEELRSEQRATGRDRTTVSDILKIISAFTHFKKKIVSD